MTAAIAAVAGGERRIRTRRLCILYLFVVTYELIKRDGRMKYLRETQTLAVYEMRNKGK
jgi:hypothetical protein